MIDTGGIKNIILDLGGVILELDVGSTIRAFHTLGFPRMESSDIILSKYPFFLEFETGRISSEEFICRIMEIAEDHISRDQVLEAWNTMILGFRESSVRLLLRLRKQFRLFLLSNTNAIHEVYYNDQLASGHGIENLDRIFEKVYYSHKLKLRKPDPEIFRFVLDDSNLVAGECLYIDDTPVHVETARSLGIRAYHLEAPQRITDIL
jgi:putative hydrolase of the HAD superfamily